MSPALAMLLAGLVGSATGVGQAWLLRRSAQRPGTEALGSVLRLLLVGGVLTGAALLGRLLPCAIGWALGMAAGALVLLRRWS